MDWLANARSSAQHHICDEIIPGQLWAGECPCTGFTDFLQKTGITTVLTLAPAAECGRQFDPASWGVQEHRYSPLYDSVVNSGADLPWLEREVEWVVSQLAAGGTVYVHCVAGVSRTGMVVAAVLMRLYRLDAAIALAYLTSRRAGTDPNPYFRTLLDAYEQCCRERGWI